MPLSGRVKTHCILVVAEKPLQGREIAVALLAGSATRELPQGGVMGVSTSGDEVLVTWAEGHLLEMVKPNELRPEWGSPWRKEVLPMIPPNAYIPRRPITGVIGRLNLLARWINEADEVVNACDAGPEGELIFDEICRFADQDQDAEASRIEFTRMWIDDTRREALRDAFQKRRRSNLNRSKNQREAARARADADWLYGYNCTRYATCALSKPDLPLLVIGRVQTPTLGVVAERDRDILAFAPEPFEFAPMKFRGETTKEFEAYLVAFPSIRYGNVDHHFHPGPEIRDIRQELFMTATTPWRVTDLATPRLEYPPAPFNLVDLQRSAFNLFKWTAGKTLSVAQALYAREKAITYPRTDSNKVPPGMREQVEGTREALYYGWALKRFPGLKGAVLPTETAHWEGGVSDHHAILPTGLIPQAWDQEDNMRDEFRLWELIVVRTFLAWLPPASIAAVKRLMMRPWRKDTVLRASIEVEPVDEPGWLWWEDQMFNTRGYGPALADRMREVALPDAGNVALMAAITIKQGHTSPPKHFDEATLLAWMQRSSMGTAATRAQIIEELINHGYVMRTGTGHIIATRAGTMMVAMLEEKLEDEVTGEAYARQTEEFLERIAGLAKDRPTRQRLWENIESKVRSIGAKLLNEENAENTAYCPKTGQPSVLDPSGKYYTFAGYKEARFYVSFLSRKMTAHEYAQVLAGNARGAGPFPGFKSKAGNTFSAYLVYVPKKKKVDLVFKR